MPLFTSVNITLLGFVLLTSSCTVAPDPETLSLLLTTDPASLDPAAATDVAMGRVNALMYDHLLRFDHESHLIPALAKRWTVSADRRRYHFYLRDDVHFQNGDHLTADAVRFSFERVLNPDTKSRRTWLFNRVAGAGEFMAGLADTVAGFRVPGELEFEIELVKPFAPFPGFLAMPAAAVVNPRQVLDKSFAINESGAGSGPWILTKWVRDGNLIFRRNPDHFLGEPSFKQLKIRILSEVMPQSAEFVTGYIDIMAISPVEYPLWRVDPEWGNRIQLLPELNIVYAAMNCSRPPFNDVRVRQAMNLAVDREKILRQGRHGQGLIAAGPIPPGVFGYDGELQPYPYDPERARVLLAEAGYPDGFTVELWQAQSLELLQFTEAIQAQLAEIGVRVKLVLLDWNLFTEAIVNGKPDMYYRQWFADYPDGENFLSPLFHSSESMRRWNRYANPEVDALIEKAQEEMDPAVRFDLIRRTNVMIHDDAPWIFMWHSTTAYITQPSLENWSPSAMFNAEKYVYVTRKSSDRQDL